MGGKVVRREGVYLGGLLGVNRAGEVGRWDKPGMA